MNFQPWIGPLSLVLAAYAAYHAQKQTKLQKEQLALLAKDTDRQRRNVAIRPWWKTRLIPVLAILVALAWYPQFANRLEQSYNIPNVSYGEVQMISPTEMVLRMRGDLGLLPSELRSDYYAIAIAVHYTGELDSKDTQGVQKSAPHDMIEGVQTFLIHPDTKFLEEYNKGLRGTNYGFVFLPKSVAPDQFKTLRQALALGGHVAIVGAGPT